MRRRLELTQAGLAELLGFSVVSVNKWENGQSKPAGLSAVVLELLAAAMRRQPPAIVASALGGCEGRPGSTVRAVAVVATLVHLSSRGRRP